MDTHPANGIEHNVRLEAGRDGMAIYAACTCGHFFFNLGATPTVTSAIDAQTLHLNRMVQPPRKGTT